MNRIAISLIFAIGMAGAASGSTIFRSGALADNDIRVIAGAVNADGSVAHGTGFVAERLALGSYRVTFTDDRFLKGCPVIVVSTNAARGGATIGAVPCHGPFTVMTYGLGGNIDSYFTFIARDTKL